MAYKPFWHWFVLQDYQETKPLAWGSTLYVLFLVLVCLSLHRWDFLFFKIGKKAFLLVLAKFYKFIFTRFGEVGKHQDYLAMVKDKTGSGR